MKSIKVIVLALLVSMISSVCKSDEVEADKVNTFFREFELLCMEGNTNGLANIISLGQQKWCFEEAIKTKINPNIVAIKFDIDSNSIVIGPEKITVSGMAYRKMKDGRRTGKTQMDFAFERRGERLILVDTKWPLIESNNLLMEKGAELGERMKNAINNGDKDGVKQVLGENDDSIRSEGLRWVREAITNDNILVKSYQVSWSKSKITVTFITNENSKQSHSLDLVTRNDEGVAIHFLAESERDSEQRQAKWYDVRASPCIAPRGGSQS